MTEWTLKDGERLDDLVRDGMRLIQRPDQFCFSVDSVLLAHYVKPRQRIASQTSGRGQASSLSSSRRWGEGISRPLR